MWMFNDENCLLLCLVLFLRRCRSHHISFRILLLLRMKCMGSEYSIKLLSGCYDKKQKMDGVLDCTFKIYYRFSLIQNLVYLVCLSLRSVF